MQLSNLLADLPDARLTGDPNTSIRGLAYDSRAVEPGFLFAAIRGLDRDGNEFVDQALTRGAVAVLSARSPESRRGSAAWVQIADERVGLALMARTYYGRPDDRMTMIGVTGTNGKSSVTYLLEAILKAAGRKPCLMGTMVYRHGRDELKAERTTPESLDLYRYLDRFATTGARSCAMEVSSHALSLNRVAGIRFQVAVFTNLTQDHLDFHKTMESYLEAKTTLFRGLDSGAVAVLNIDDPASRSLRLSTRARVLTYGASDAADVRLVSARFSREGVQATLAIAAGITGGSTAVPPRLEIRSPLLGRHNAQNLMACVAAGFGLGVPVEAMVEGIGSLSSVPGRLERVDAGEPFMVLVDYAHTDDALAKLVAAVRDLEPRRILTVFGCGGDRDRAKRPKMGRAAASGSDIVVVTSDNPRSEDPMAIIEEILPGVRHALTGDPRGDLDPERCLVIPDRRAAIHRALSMARAGDCVVIAGKGHEPYQILGDRTVPFDDRLVARDYLERAGKSRGQAAG